MRRIARRRLLLALPAVITDHIQTKVPPGLRMLLA